MMFFSRALMIAVIIMVVPSLGMEVSSRQVSTIYSQQTMLDMLPLDIQNYIGTLILKLEDVDFSKMDCYEKCVAHEKKQEKHRPEIEDVTTQEWVYKVGTRPSCTIITCFYSEQDLKIVGGSSYDNILVRTISPQKKICDVSCFHSKMDFFKQRTISPQGTILATLRSNDNLLEKGWYKLALWTIHTGNKIHTEKLEYSDYIPRIYFKKDIIEIFTQDSVHRLHFCSPLHQSLINFSFTWRQALLVSRLYSCFKKYERFLIDKDSYDYETYYQIPKDIRSFFEKYMNVIIWDGHKKK